MQMRGWKNDIFWEKEGIVALRDDKVDKSWA